MPGPLIEKLRDTFDHDPLTGTLTWKPRPPEAFAHGKWRTWTARFCGQPAKAYQNKGYQVVGIIDGGTRYKVSVHRVIWALEHGRWPFDQLDHRNGDRSDNRLVNLREATNSGNSQNVRLRPMQGTWVNPKTGRFKARIHLNGKHMWLGQFATREEAHLAYLAARSKFYQFATSR